MQNQRRRIARIAWAVLPFIMTTVITVQPHAENKNIKKSEEGRAETLQIFNGRPKVLVVHGYSTSHTPNMGLFDNLNGWPELLQTKLDRFFEGERIIQVVGATENSTPIARWMDVQNGKPLGPWLKTLKPALQAHKNRPVIVLAQQSLQWAFGERFEGIASPKAHERIEKGAGIIEQYVNRLKADGADWVFISMHIYGAVGPSPILQGEWLALDAFFEREVLRVFRGPELWKTLEPYFPYAYADDHRHPGKAAAHVMAHHWFQTLLAHDGLSAPKWSHDKMQAAIQAAKTRVD